MLCKLEMKRIMRIMSFASLFTAFFRSLLDSYEDFADGVELQLVFMPQNCRIQIVRYGLGYT